MYYVQNTIYCGVCNKLLIANISPNHLETEGCNIVVLVDHCINSTIVKTHLITKQNKTEIVNFIANEAIYQLQY